MVIGAPYLPTLSPECLVLDRAMILSALDFLPPRLGRHRARCLRVRLPVPPLRPVRETFASYGSRQRDIMGEDHFASSTVHSPWTALRVRWVPVYCFPTLSLRAFAMCVAFLHSDYYALFDFPRWPWSFVGLSLTYFPPSFTSTMGSPVFTMEDSSEILEVACFWVPLPRFAAPQC